MSPPRKSNTASHLVSFPCPLVHSLLCCLLTSAPFACDVTSVPTKFSEPPPQYMTNFTTMFLMFGCGYDLCSLLQYGLIVSANTGLASMVFPSQPPRHLSLLK
ncbi:hypothetical protein EDD16DRAFT_1540517 [Pisolithus croceorrhizus]|nr:hypothetical protein F5141DRAFT_1149802 [Pisolithus sp. B1]KAI6113812.1 hypothetical protein EV401DRAFT_1981677 [Pisolithus croceorrhizus]KAI6130750.1 hypothetical protein EDD16DRAFT_1540517 [Pisolithus croceorrhizus]KAI6161234.1 hypothetical protein EDD17DRAFT_707906 [Pisolithus thermaeus]